MSPGHRIIRAKLTRNCRREEDFGCSAEVERVRVEHERLRELFGIE